MFGPILNCEDPKVADFVVLCVPYDRTSSYGRGSDKGPAAIVDALGHQIEPYERIVDSTPINRKKIAVSDLGNLNHLAPEQMITHVGNHCAQFLKAGKFLFLLGGEHSVSNAPLRALASIYSPQEVTICQIDAHLDLRHDDSDYSSLQNGPYSHSTVMRRSVEMGYKTVHIGARAFSEEEREYGRAHGCAIFEWGRNVPSHDQILDAISTPMIYLSIDADGFDPAHLPATGTPVQGGLEWYYGLHLIESLLRRKQLIGADIVEVAPRAGDVLTEYGAAQLCYTIIALQEKYGSHPWPHSSSVS